MPDSQGRYQWVIKLVNIWTVLAVGLLGIVFAACAVKLTLLVRAAPADGAEDLLKWVVALVAIPVAAVAVVIGRGLLGAIVSNESGVREIADHMKRMESLTEAVHDSSRRLADLAQLSDTAKSLLYRRRELEAMNELLHEHLIRQDYAAAEAFVNDAEELLGYAEQVEQMRKEIAEARETTLDQKVDSAINRMNRAIMAQEWAQAFRQGRRLQELVPDNPKVAAAVQSIRDARAGHKRELLGAYGDAVRTSDIDRSIELLRELDKYLSPQEAAALKESARGVFRAKIHYLGVQFSIRVTDEQWDEALAIGRQIIEEYPNSRMAQEVREKMDQLQALAEQRSASDSEQT